jgi:hypothetical protein
VKKLRYLVALMCAAAVALLGATVAQPTSESNGVRTLRTPPVMGLAADGSFAAVATVCGANEYRLYAWNPVRRRVVSMARRRERRCYGASTGEGVWEAGIAGRRLAWVPFSGGNFQQAWLVTAAITRPRATTQLTEMMDRNTHNFVGTWVGNVHGDGPLLVFNTWSACESTPEGGSCPEGTPPGIHIYDEKIWRIIGRRRRLMLATPDEASVLAVAAGRILVQHADGSLELRRADGSLVRAFPFGPKEVRGAVLDASELVVLQRSGRLTWRVYDLLSGDERARPAPAGATLADVERGLLVYTRGRTVHVLRLADGRQTIFRTPPPTTGCACPPSPHAQLEPSGLFYSYQVRGEGRVRFIPFNQIRFR